MQARNKKSAKKKKKQGKEAIKKMGAMQPCVWFGTKYKAHPTPVKQAQRSTRTA